MKDDWDRGLGELREAETLQARDFMFHFTFVASILGAER